MIETATGEWAGTTPVLRQLFEKLPLARTRADWRAILLGCPSAAIDTWIRHLLTLGTGPDDDPLLRAERRKSRAVGRTEARVETQRDAVLQVLELRGLPVSAALSRHLAQLQGISTAELIEAALHCRDEDDFLRRTRRKQR